MTCPLDEPNATNPDLRMSLLRKATFLALLLSIVVVCYSSVLRKEQEQLLNQMSLSLLLSGALVFVQNHIGFHGYHDGACYIELST